MKCKCREAHSLIACALASAGLLAAAPVVAGGLSLYEIGTEDVGLASAGYTARAQDASTVFTNPAGMTRLEGTQATWAGRCSTAPSRSASGREPRRRSAAEMADTHRLVSGRRRLLLLQRVARRQARFRRHRQFRPVARVRLQFGSAGITSRKAR